MGNPTGTIGIGCLQGPERRLNFIGEYTSSGVLSGPIVLGLCKLIVEKSIESSCSAGSGYWRRGGGAIGSRG